LRCHTGKLVRLHLPLHFYPSASNLRDEYRFSYNHNCQRRPKYRPERW
jgi:hypothetical protein